MWTPGKLPANFSLLLTLTRRRLSADDRRLVRLLVLGCSQQQIAAMTGKPLAEVRRRRRAVMRKTGSRTLAMLSQYARVEGIVSEGEVLTDR